MTPASADGALHASATGPLDLPDSVGHSWAAGLTRLELVATLRELGLSHAEVRSVLSRENTVADVAALHGAALDAQITTVRFRRGRWRAEPWSTAPAVR